MVLDADTLKIIYGSAIRPRTFKNHYQRLVDAGGEEVHQPHSKPLKHPNDGDQPTGSDVPTVFIKSRHVQRSACHEKSLSVMHHDHDSCVSQ